MADMTHSIQATRTERLTLSRPTERDLPELHALHADPEVWKHLPSARHTELADTRELVDRYLAGWEVNGVDVWVARDTATRASVGMGGPSLRGGHTWNIYYRLAPSAWGRGYPQEIVAAARKAVSATGRDLPLRSSMGSSMKSFGWRVFGWGVALTVVVVVGGFILRSFGAVAA
jgi:RimJ/RimL family protein N-acetyltransferase